LPAKNPVGASIQKEESGIFLLRDARWITGVFNERIDRPIIRYLFGAEPRAWFALMPPESDHTAQMLAAVQALVPMGLRLALKDIYQAFRFRIPADDDPCLTPPPGAATTTADAFEEGAAPSAESSAEEAENSNSKDQNSRKFQTPNSKPDIAAAPSPERDPVIPAQTTDADPIAPGADPGRWQQFNPAMPDTQVDAAAFWSRSGLAPRGADGQTLPLPSLGHSLPNGGDRRQEPEDRIQNLQRMGLGNTRAAQSLRQVLANPRGSAALSRRTEINGQSSSSALPTNELHTA
jgi:hypothetical protein